MTPARTVPVLRASTVTAAATIGFAVSIDASVSRASPMFACRLPKSKYNEGPRYISAPGMNSRHGSLSSAMVTDTFVVSRAERTTFSSGAGVSPRPSTVLPARIFAWVRLVTVTSTVTAATEPTGVVEVVTPAKVKPTIVVASTSRLSAVMTAPLPISAIAVEPRTYA